MYFFDYCISFFSDLVINIDLCFRTHLLQRLQKIIFTKN